MAADHPPIIRVKRREELVAALKQRTVPIVIENEELARPFERYARTQYWWLMRAFTAFLIMRSFPQIEFRRTEWRVDVMPQHKVILTPWR
jgi:hypothetical protein